MEDNIDKREDGRDDEEVRGYSFVVELMVPFKGWGFSLSLGKVFLSTPMQF